MNDWRSYDGVAEVYERVHAPRFVAVARDLLALAGVSAGARVLDVGTGTGVAAAAAAAAGAGAAVLLWSMPLWGEVKHGFFKLMGVLLLVLGSLTWLSASSGAIEGDVWGSWSVRLTVVTVALTGTATALMFARRYSAARIGGCIAAAASVAVLAAMAGTGRQATPLALFQLLAGAAFLGSVLDGLMLGHWYLTDRGLPRGPINRYTTAMLVAVAVEALAVISSGFTGTGSSQAFNPLLTVGALAPWIAMGMVATTGLIAALTRAALKGERASAVQSATGFYYLAVVTAVTAELAVKTRFFAG